MHASRTKLDAIVTRSRSEMHTFLQAAKETCGTGEVGDSHLWGGKSGGGHLLIAESPSVFGYFSKLVTGTAGSRTRGGASVDAKPGARVVSKASIDRRFLLPASFLRPSDKLSNFLSFERKQLPNSATVHAHVTIGKARSLRCVNSTRTTTPKWCESHPAALLTRGCRCQRRMRPGGSWR